MLDFMRRRTSRPGRATEAGVLNPEMAHAVFLRLAKQGAAKGRFAGALTGLPGLRVQPMPSGDEIVFHERTMTGGVLRATSATLGFAGVPSLQLHFVFLPPFLKHVLKAPMPEFRPLPGRRPGHRVLVDLTPERILRIDCRPGLVDPAFTGMLLEGTLVTLDLLPIPSGR